MIFAIDPGGTTGIAYLTRDGQFGTDEIPNGAEGMWDWLLGYLQSDPKPDAVVIENFVPRPGAHSMQLDALHIIGAVRYLCAVRDIPLIVQTPAQAKAFATNDKLKAAGWYTVGADHARDAARHLLVFCAGQIYRTLGGSAGPYHGHVTALMQRVVAGT